MTAIVDYGVGNLFSLRSSLAAIGEDATVTGDARVLRSADRLLLPGVGAFADAAEKLRAGGLADVILERVAAGVPLLGICLGMQMLFDTSYEYGEHRGLGLIGGEVRPIRERISPTLKIPHIGWNPLTLVGARHPVMKYINDGDCVYFVHSYAAEGCEGSVIATAEYSVPLTAAVARDNVVGCQFHPEKSGRVGLSILRGFLEWGGR